MDNYSCPKCGEDPGENNYTYIKEKYFLVDRDEGSDMWRVVKQKDRSRDFRYNLIPDSEVYPKITNRHYTGSMEWSGEECWNEEHKCDKCGTVFSFQNGSH